MNIVHVKIDVSNPAGQRLLREIEKHPEAASVEFSESVPPASTKTYTMEEVFGKVEEDLNNHYGTSHKLKL